jgi:L-rhamnose mutarotase
MRYIKSDSLDEFRADMAKIGEDEETQRWWKVSAL